MTHPGIAPNKEPALCKPCRQHRQGKAFEACHSMGSSFTSKAPQPIIGRSQCHEEGIRMGIAKKLDELPPVTHGPDLSQAAAARVDKNGFAGSRIAAPKLFLHPLSKL